jgi:light-regulated signal transduction histidine kinase (bacteriophytochrome)
MINIKYLKNKLNSPVIRLFIGVLVAIFTIEFSIHILIDILILNYIPSYLQSFLHGFIDSLMLVLIVFPVIYFLSYKPLLLQIRERERVEEKLKQTMAEFARSNSELELFAYVASHDLQEPLRMVTSFTQLLEKRYKNKLDKDADEFIEFILDGATRMQSMINDLLQYSRVGTRGKPFKLTDFESVFGQSLVNLKIAIDENNAIITHDPLPTLMADSTQMIEVFQNLISNAIKFRSKESPQVHVSALKKRNEWVFSVRDNGIGIAPEFFDKLFIIFQRLHSRSEYPGTGIGLAVCKKIVERHGGKIWVESEPDKGSTFYFSIPDSKGE